MGLIYLSTIGGDFLLQLWLNAESTVYVYRRNLFYRYPLGKKKGRSPVPDNPRSRPPVYPLPLTTSLPLPPPSVSRGGGSGELPIE